MGFVRMYIYKYSDLNYTLKSESGKVLKRDGMAESRKMENTENPAMIINAGERKSNV